MKSSLRRRVASVVLAVLAFAQLSTAFASCFMDRGGMGAMMSAEGAMPCEGCDTAPSPAAALKNLCVAHCTADLQIFVGAQVPVCCAPRLPVLTILPFARSHVPKTRVVGAHPGDPPPRILLHSFLI